GGSSGTQSARLRLSGHKLDGATAQAVSAPTPQHHDQRPYAAPPAPRGELPLEATSLRLCRAGSASGPEKGGLIRRLRAGWRAGDVLLCCLGAGIEPATGAPQGRDGLGALLA